MPIDWAVLHINPFTIVSVCIVYFEMVSGRNVLIGEKVRLPFGVPEPIIPNLLRLRPVLLASANASNISSSIN